MTETVTMIMDFAGAKTSTTFYVCETSSPIIGIDQLRNNGRQISINTKSEKFHIGKSSFETESTVEKSIENFKKREKIIIEFSLNSIGR